MPSPSDNSTGPTSTELATRDQDSQLLSRDLQRIEKLATLMDDQFKVPVVGWRVGLDPIIGLLPVGGDWVTWVASVYILWVAVRLDAPMGLLGAMTVNIVIDLITGYVPGAGDLFDAAFKANRKNVNLLLEHFGATERNGRIELDDSASSSPETGRLTRYAFGALATLVLLVMAAIPVLLLWWLLQG